MERQIRVQKSDANLDELLALAHEGTDVIIMEGDEPLARLTSAEVMPHEAPQQRILGAHPGAWLSHDFDEPLGDDFWLGEAE